MERGLTTSAHANASGPVSVPRTRCAYIETDPGSSHPLEVTQRAGSTVTRRHCLSPVRLVGRAEWRDMCGRSLPAYLCRICSRELREQKRLSLPGYGRMHLRTCDLGAIGGRERVFTARPSSDSCQRYSDRWMQCAEEEEHAKVMSRPGGSMMQSPLGPLG